jgi:CheY-like chemotaxis protein
MGRRALTVSPANCIDPIIGEDSLTTAPFARGRVVVVDENELSRASVCAALEGAGYEAIAVATTIGLRKALAEPTAVVLCDVSPPLTYQQILATVRAVRAIADGHAPVVLSGTQSVEQLEILVRASHAAGFVERRDDPAVLLCQLRRFVPAKRSERPTARPRWDILKLLLIDDSEITLELMQEHLRQRGFDVRLAFSLGEVQSIIRGWSPNVIVADVNMPDMRGDDLCARLKAAAATRDAFVILCSGMPEESLASVADAAGADGFVSKSHGIDHFVSSIEAVCRRISDRLVSFG